MTTKEHALAAIRAASYDIIDRHTGKVVGHCKTLARALASVDKRDNAHGSYRYAHKRVTS